MHDDEKNFDQEQLRKQALERLEARHVRDKDMAPDELMHELEQYQVELEVQNEELRRAQEAIEAAVNRYRELYDDAPVAYLTLHPAGNIASANRATARLFSVELGRLKGRPFLSLLGRPDRDRVALVLRSASFTGLPQTSEFQIVRGRATRRWVHAEISWLGHDEESGGYRVMLLDVTSRVRINDALVEQRSAALRSAEEAVEARQRAERATEWLRKSEERFRLASDAGAALVYEVNLADSRAVIVHGIERVTGFRPESHMTSEAWDGLIHPHDLKTYHEHLEHRLRADRPCLVEYRMRHSSGTWIIVADTGQVFRDEHGAPNRMVGAIVDITDRRSAETELRDANQRKDEFLATLAHELRNPLAPIRNAVQVLRARDPGVKDVQWARDVIDRQTDRMARLVDDLLDVSRITRGKLELRKERLELRAVLDDAVEAARPLIDQAGLTLRVDVPDEVIVLDADRARLSQAVTNLLNNAAKFTPRGGEVWLSADREPERASIHVRDSGIGIDDQVLPHVFDMFVQGEKSIEQSHGGIGIGLTLVRRLVELHGGEVEAHSKGPGSGSEFVIRLPVAPGDSVGKETKHPGEEVRQNGDGRRVLVVDDNRDSADSMAIFLRLIGHEVATAHDGIAAIAKCNEFKPDLVLLDIGLPGLNGYDVARKIREQHGDRVILIAMTGWGQDEDRRRAHEAGFNHHLTKPVDFNVLNTVLGAPH
jgi:two-component system CheB/CheR fusion protein